MHSSLKAYFDNLLSRIIKPPIGILPYHYILPSPSPDEQPTGESAGQFPIDTSNGTNPYIGKAHYAEQYDWDLYFLGVAFSKSYPEKMRYFKEGILNFLSFTTASGRTPRTISPLRFWDPYDQHKPFLAQGVLLSGQHFHDFSWVKGTIWQKLVAFINFWEDRRGFHGLSRWRCDRESGVDNNSTILNTPDFYAESVDVNVYLYREYCAMKSLAKEIGEDPAVWEEKADFLRLRINTVLWSAEDDIYYDVVNFSDTDIQHIKVKAWSVLTPLWVGLPDTEHARKMIERYVLNTEEYLAPHGIRSLSKSEITYNTSKKDMMYIHSEGRRWVVSNWQGPVWVVVNWMITHGLVRYGYKEEALKIAKKVIKTLENDLAKNGGLHENYHPETGESLWAPNFGSWNFLALSWLDSLQAEENSTEKTISSLG